MTSTTTSTKPTFAELNAEVLEPAGKRLGGIRRQVIGLGEIGPGGIDLRAGPDEYRAGAREIAEELKAFESACHEEVCSWLTRRAGRDVREEYPISLPEGAECIVIQHAIAALGSVYLGPQSDAEVIHTCLGDALREWWGRYVARIEAFMAEHVG